MDRKPTLTKTDTPLLGGYDEPEILPCAIWPICLKGADAGHYEQSQDLAMVA